MTIGKKLYLGFGAILTLLLLVFVVNLSAVLREHSVRNKAAATLQSLKTIESVRYQMMQARLDLRNFLLSGDPHLEAKTNKEEGELSDYLQNQRMKTTDETLRSALLQVGESEEDWHENFAKSLIDKRHQVDSGDATVSDLQVFYLGKKPGSWIGKDVNTLDNAEVEIQKSNDDANASAKQASDISTIGSSVGVFIAILLGVGISFYTAKSITQPLGHLIEVAHEIGSAGDLDHSIDIRRNDEVGRLADNFRAMVEHLAHGRRFGRCCGRRLDSGDRATIQAGYHGAGVLAHGARIARDRPAGPRQRFASCGRRKSNGRCFGGISQSQLTGRVRYR